MTSAIQRVRCTGAPQGASFSLIRGLCRRLWRAGRRLGLSPAALASLGLHLVDDQAMARLHVEHMGLRGPTDVLSFPTGDAGAGGLGPGDIVINVDAAARQARHPSGAGLLDELAALAIHGLAHLLGHDHGERREGRAMHRVERRALRAARVPDIPRPYGLAPRRGR